MNSKKVIILILFFFFSFYSFAQKIDTIFFNSKWKLSSKAEASYFRLVSKASSLNLYEIRDYYLSGKIQMVGYYKSLVPDIEWNKYNEIPQTLAFKDSICTWYSISGYPQHQVTYKNNTVTGRMKFWDEKGILRMEVDFKDSIEHGLIIEYFADGSKAYEGHLNQKIKTGKWTYWYTNKQIAAIVNYKDGKLNGRIDEWYENGKPKSEKYYFEDLPVGDWYLYSESGSKNLYKKTDKNNMIVFIPKWKKNERKDFKFTIEETVINDKQKVFESLFSASYELQIIDSTKENYKLQMSPVFIFSNNSQNQDLVNNILFPSYLFLKNSKFIFQIDKNGIFEELVNWKDCQKYGMFLCDSLINFIKSENAISDYKSDSIRTELYSQFSSKENITAFIMEFVSVLFSMYNQPLPVNEKYEKNIETYFALFASNIPLISSVFTKKSNSNPDCFDITVDLVTPDFKEKNAAIRMIKKNNPNLNINEMPFDDSFKINTNTKLQINQNSGWLKSVSTKTIMSVKKIKRLVNIDYQMK